MHKNLVVFLLLTLFGLSKTIHAACYTQGSCCLHSARLFTPDKPIIPAISRVEALARTALLQITEMREDIKTLQRNLDSHKAEVTEHLELLTQEIQRLQTRSLPDNSKSYQQRQSV